VPGHNLHAQGEFQRHEIRLGPLHLDRVVVDHRHIDLVALGIVLGVCFEIVAPQRCRFDVLVQDAVEGEFDVGGSEFGLRQVLTIRQLHGMPVDPFAELDGVGEVLFVEVPRFGERRIPLIRIREVLIGQVVVDLALESRADGIVGRDDI